MRYLFTIILLTVFCVAFSAEKLVLKTGVELGNSSTTNFIGGGFAVPEWSAANNVDLSGGLKITNEQKISAFLSNTIKIPIKKYELRVMDKFLYNSYNAWNIREFLFFAGLGTAINRFDGTLGISYRIITRKDSFRESIFEPANLQYDLGVSLFPHPQTWNLRLGISNYDVFLFERTESIIFSLKGDYRISNRLGVFAVANLRPAGNFHLSATYYSFYVQTGIRWIIF